jgi:hypothetical protein
VDILSIFTAVAISTKIHTTTPASPSITTTSGFPQPLFDFFSLIFQSFLYTPFDISTKNPGNPLDWIS